MTWRPGPTKIIRRVTVSLLFLFLSSCMGSGSGTNIMLRSASPHITNSDELFRQPPNCVIIMPLVGDVVIDNAKIVETVVARHFSQRLSRIVDPTERRTLERHGAYNLSDPVELRRFARMLGCGYGLEIIVHAAADTYGLIWAWRHFDLTLTLVRIGDERVIWSARHALNRSAGGLPTGPLSLVLDSARAASFASNHDGNEALVEDVVRQTVQGFPDLR